MKKFRNSSKNIQGKSLQIQDMEKRISGIEDVIEDMNISVKEHVKSKRFLGTKYPGNMSHSEKRKI